MLRSMPLVFALALLAPMTVQVAMADEAGVPFPEEKREFDAALRRFKDRAEMVRSFAVAELNEQESSARERGLRRYDQLLEEANIDVLTKRAVTIKQLEHFLSHYAASARADDVRLRLSELYYQQASEAQLAAAREFNRRLSEIDDIDLIEELEAEGMPKIDLAPSIELLSEVVKRNREREPDERFSLLDVSYYMLGFTFSERNGKQYDRERARSVFRELADTLPESEWADAAHLLLGEFAFEDNDFEASIPEFKVVVDGGSERKYFMNALYKLAWANYKLDRFDEAMVLFTDMLDRSEAQRQRTGRASDYKEDGVEYLALSLLDQGDIQGTSPLDRARRFFAELPGQRAWEWDVLAELAEALRRYDRPLDSVEVYEYLQTTPAFALRPENPTFLASMIEQLRRGLDPDMAERAGDAQLAMSERYGEGTPWWNANRNNPEAIAVARGFVETYLIDVAREVRFRAAEAGDPALFAEAADRYREYLDRFPISDGYYEYAFELSDSLLRGNRHREAVDAFEQLIRSSRFHDFGDAAVFYRLAALRQLVQDEVGPFQERAADAEVERTYTSAGGQEITVYALTPEQEAFIAAADAVVAHEFGPPLASLDADFGDFADRIRPANMYQPAQMLYYANRYDEARPRLKRLFEELPRTNEAAFAANLYLNTWINEGDSAEIRRWSRAFASMRLGPTDSMEVADLQQSFQNTLERTVFSEAAEAQRRGDYVEAAEGFLAFMREFPRSENLPLALLSAADSYSAAGRTVDANDLIERFINEYPEHPEAKRYFLRIAELYQGIFEFDKAIRYYDERARRYPDDTDASTAVYMIAFLKEGLGDNAGAAEGYERYARQFPAASDREETHFRAGAQYEQVSAERAIRFYRSYLQEYGLQAPDRALQAQARIADLMRDMGRDAAAERELDAVVELYGRIIDAGVEVGPAGRYAAAEAAFRDLQARLDNILAAKVEPLSARNLAPDLEREIRKLTALDAEVREELFPAIAAYVNRYPSIEWVIAARYVGAKALAHVGNLGLSIQPPPGLPWEVEAAFLDLLEGNVYPPFRDDEQEAVEILEGVVRFAREQRRHAKWVDLALEELNRISPMDFAAVKEEYVGTIEARVPPRISPLSPPAASGPAEEETP